MPLYNLTVETEPVADAERESERLLDLLLKLEHAGVLESPSGVAITEEGALATIFDVRAPSVSDSREALKHLGYPLRSVAIEQV